MKRLDYLGPWLVALAVTAALPAGAGAIETDPLPVTTTSRPFFAATIDLAAHGYVEEEYLVRGTGNVYEYDAQGEVRIQIADVPYATRILVRRPAAADFNGVVLLEMLNPTAGFDIDFEWHYNRELLLAEGYVWVGVTIKDVAIDYLRFWDPDRYATLHMVDRGLAYDLFAQLGALLRDDADPDNPLAGYPVAILVGTGYSQSADYLTTFGNEFHDQALLADGRHAFDGYLNAGGNGGARAINSADPNLYTDQRRYRTVDARLIQVQSETELAIFNQSSFVTRQPDSDRFRLYEIPGGSHADTEGLLRTGEVIARDVGGPPLPPCGEPLSPLAIGPVHRASLANLVHWIDRGTPPPPGRQIDTDAQGNVLRDGFGNATGGVRVPMLAVPLGRFEPGNLGPLPCPLAGAYYEFDEATLAALYPTHGAYLRRVTRSALDSALHGYLRWDDALRYILEAARSGVGR